MCFFAYAGFSVLKFNNRDTMKFVILSTLFKFMKSAISVSLLPTSVKYKTYSTFATRVDDRRPTVIIQSDGRIFK